MNKDDFCKGGIGTGEAGGEAQRWGRREAARVGTSESCILQQALTHWEDDRSAVPFLLRMRNSQSAQLYSASSRAGEWGVEGRDLEHWRGRQGWALGHSLQLVLLLRLPAAAEGRIPRAWAGCGAEAQLPQPGWALGAAAPLRVLSAAGARLRCCQPAAPNEAHKLLRARLGVCQLGQVSPGRDVTWERCHLAEMSLGRVVTLLPCGQLGTICGDAVLYLLSPAQLIIFDRWGEPPLNLYYLQISKRKYIFLPVLYTGEWFCRAEESDQRPMWFLPLWEKEQRKCVRRMQNEPKSWFSLRLLQLSYEQSAESPDPQSWFCQDFWSSERLQVFLCCQHWGQGLELPSTASAQTWDQKLGEHLQVRTAIFSCFTSFMLVMWSN